MKKIGYMGFNERIILELIENRECKLNFVITQKDRLSRTMLKLLEVIDIPYYIVENKNDLIKYDNLYKEVDLELLYQIVLLINIYALIFIQEI